MKKKILIATNLFQVDPIVYSGHLQMFYKFGQDNDIEIVFNAPWRTPIDVARNKAAEIALTMGCDYLFFYDDDMFFENGKDALDLIKKVIDSDGKINILQGLAFIRGYPFKPMIFKIKDIEDNNKKMMTYDDYEDHIQEDGLVKVDAVGCCATVIDVNLFKLIPKPYFLTGQEHTEDIYFCVKCQQYIKEVGIYCDTTKKIGHLLEKLVLTDANRHILKKIHEEYNLNQLFLPDPTFIPGLQQASKSMAYDVQKRVNPIEFLQNKEIADGK